MAQKSAHCICWLHCYLIDLNEGQRKPTIGIQFIVFTWVSGFAWIAFLTFTNRGW